MCIRDRTNTAHGLTMCPLAVPYLEMTWDADIERHAKLTRLFGYGDDTMPQQQLAELCPCLLYTSRCV